MSNKVFESKVEDHRNSGQDRQRGKESAALDLRQLCALVTGGLPMADYKLISADSHFVEPPNMWAERIDKKFRERAPHVVRGVNGQDAEFFVCENINPV